jgi:deaminated glutathione amidase
MTDQPQPAAALPNPPLAAIMQMTSGTDPDKNLAHIAAAMEQAASQGAAMLLLPEMSLLLDRDRQRAAPHISAEQNSPHLVALQNLARQHRLWLHTGSIAFLADDGQRRVNRTHIIDADGQIQARYDKIHMFDVSLPNGEAWTESALYNGGDQAVVVDTPLGKMGLSICYDLRFGELYRRLTDLGAEVIAIPAAFTAPTGAAHWHVLMRARAIETGCHILAAAQCGDHADGRATYGHSLIVAPWGELIGDAGGADGDADRPSGSASDTSGEQAFRLLYAPIDPQQRSKARSAIPLDRSRSMRAIRL